MHAPVGRNLVFADLVGGSASAHLVSCVRQVHVGHQDVFAWFKESDDDLVPCPESYDTEDDMTQ